MIPLLLTLAGFLSYREPVELDFTTFDLACIAGPNGAGKSSLLDALTWALFGQARKRDDALINAQSSAARVGLVFSYEDTIYRVQRTKPREKATLLEFHILQSDQERGNLKARYSQPGVWKPLTERTLRETEALIEHTLRLDYDTFVNASFFLQGKADQFTQQRPGDRKRILSSILGLEAWESYRKRASDRRKEVENQISELEGRLQEIKAELAEESPRRARLGELENELARLAQTRQAQESALENLRRMAAALAEQARLVEALAHQLAGAARRLEELQNRLAERQAERAALAVLVQRAGDIQAAYTAWQEARAALNRWEEIAGRFREQEKRRQEPLNELAAAQARLRQENEMLQTAQEQAEAAQAQLQALQERKIALQQALAQAEAQLDRRAGLEAQLSEARQRQAEARAENPRLKAEMDELKERIQELSALEGAACPLCGKPLDPADRGQLIAELNAHGREMGDRFRANQIYLREAEQLVRSLEGQIAGLSRVDSERLGYAQDLAQLAARQEGAEETISAWQTRGAPRLVEIKASLEQEDFAPEARARLGAIDAELKAIGYDAAAHDAARRTEASGRAAEEQLRALEKAQAALAPLESMIADLLAQAPKLAAEEARQREEYTSAAAALAAAQAQTPDLDQAERDLFILKEQENRLRLEVGAARQRVNVLHDLKIRCQELEAQRAELALRVTQYRQLERSFGKDGVPALLIEQALPQIETKANEILERLSAGSMSVRFATQTAFKDKARDDLRETLDILISDGAGTRDYELFSGGEAFRVNFAIRLALSEVLAQRAGARLQTLVIDEGFGSQDTQGRQRLLEAINLVGQDFAKVLVITHIDELKEAFPNRIEVEKNATGSCLRIV
jgi:exonuclease SbcC